MQGILKLTHRAMADDTRPVDTTCACMVSQYLEGLIASELVLFICNPFYYFFTGLQNIYKGLHSLPCYKRCYGISASVVSQLVLHAEGIELYME